MTVSAEQTEEIGVVAVMAFAVLFIVSLIVSAREDIKRLEDKG